MLNTFRECRDSAAMLQSRIREHGEEGERQFYCEMRDLLASGTIDRNRVNLRNLFETFVDDGRMMLDRMRPGYRGDDSLLFEASDATSTRAFQNIVGQITYSSVMDAMENEDFIGDQLMTTVPADTQYQEIIPGIGAIGDVAGEVSEGDPYPIVGLGEDYVIAPEKVKDGFILPITDEVIFEDKTGQLMTRANSAAEALGITREKEQLDTALGITNSYRRLGGAAQATYGATHTEGTFDKEPFDLRDRDLLHAKRGDVRSVEVEGPEGDYALLRTDAGDWAFTKPIATRAGRWKVDGLLGTLENLRMESVAAEPAESLGPYGLDRPERAVGSLYVEAVKPRRA